MTKKLKLVILIIGIFCLISIALNVKLYNELVIVQERLKVEYQKDMDMVDGKLILFDYFTGKPCKVKYECIPLNKE